MRAPTLGFALLLALALIPSTGVAQDLSLRLNGNQLYFSAPGLRFITGDALKRLRDGATVPFVFQIGTSRSRSGSPEGLVTVRFAVSYDLWEEKFAVTRSGPTPRSVSNLTLEGAEKWCLDALSLTASMPPDQPFWVTLRYHQEDSPPPQEKARSGLSLGGMVEIFSQRVQERTPARKEISAGPFRVADLRQQR